MKNEKLLDSLGNDEQGVQVKNVYLNELHPFKNHPFKVEKNLELYELMFDITKNGVASNIAIGVNKEI